MRLISELYPDRLTRFYSNIAYASELLEDRTLAMPCVNLFNDPFDPTLEINIELRTFDEFSAWLEQKEHNVLTALSSEDLEKLWYFCIEVRLEALDHIRDYIYENAYAASFCSTYNGIIPRNNLYMWGHYANGHRGIAVEFDKEALRKFGAIYEIFYTDRLPTISAKELYDFLVRIYKSQSLSEISKMSKEERLSNMILANKILLKINSGPGGENIQPEKEQFTLNINAQPVSTYNIGAVVD